MNEDISDAKTVALAAVINGNLTVMPTRILVVGCGTGREAGVLARFFDAETIGIDIEGEYEFDREAARPAELVKMDAQSMSFPDGHFGFVYSFHALEHVPDVERVLSEMNRVLAPGGVFCIGTPNKARIVGYIGSATSLKNKLLWNISDLRMRLTGRWENKYGAHAGFYASELTDYCNRHFGAAREVTREYYERLYMRHGRLLSIVLFGRLKYLICPCVYVFGQKP
jgi:ubiquinone/menaquinone biosynthesis C-methylase UbiE